MKELKALSSSSFLKLLFGYLSLAFFVAALIMPDRREMFDGLWRIMSQTAKVSTNHFDLGGYAGSFLNAALVCLACTLLYLLPKAKAGPPSVVAVLLTVGFAFWGINVLNMWFGMLGVLLYCLVKGQSPGTQVNAMLFSTGLAPLFSDLLLRYPAAEATGFSWTGLALAAGIGIFVGFILPAGIANAAKVTHGYSIYAAAVPVGITAFLLRAVLYQVLGGTLPGASGTSLEVASWNVCNIFCFVLFGVCVIVALLMGCKPKDYWNLMKDSGVGGNFAEKYGTATFLMNMGLYGLFIVLYYNLIGATFNAVTFGCIFCMLSCCNSGSHPRNVWPIMVGYEAASFLFKWLAVGEYAQVINAQAIVIGLCFANGLSPISGKYGWYFGILAGLLHFCLVTSVPLLHGGFCLYNGGFTAAFICLILVPVLEHFLPKKEEQPAANK